MTLGTPSRACTAARVLLVTLLFVTPFSNAAIEILFPCLFFSWLAGWRFSGNKGQGPEGLPSRRAVLWVLAAYLAVCVASVIISSNPVLSIVGLICKTFEYALFFVMASDIAQDLPTFRKGVTALLWAAWLVIAYAFFQEWLIHRNSVSGLPAIDPIIPRKLVYLQMVGPYWNPNDLATFLMVVALVVIALVLGRRGRLPWSHGVLALLLLGCLIWTHSRGALLGFSAGLVLLLLVYGRTRGVWIKAGFGLTVFAALLLAQKGHLLQVLSFSDIGSRERVVMWQVAWRMIQAKPVMGVGLNTFMFNYASYAGNPNDWPAYAHNCFLQVAAETGVFGLLAFCAFLVCWFAVCWRSLKSVSSGHLPEDVSLLAGAVAGVVGFLVQSAFDTNLYVLRQATLFWTLAGVALGASCAAVRTSPSSHA